MKGAGETSVDVMQAYAATEEDASVTVLTAIKSAEFRMEGVLQEGRYVLMASQNLAMRILVIAVLVETS